MTRLARLRTVLGAIVREIRAEQVTFLAGSLAYHAFVSLVPALLLLVVVLSAFGAFTSTQAVVSVVAAALTEGAAEVLLDELGRLSQSRELSTVGLLVLLWGTLRVFRGLDTAFSTIYETERQNSLPDQLLDGGIVLVAVAGALVIAGSLRGLTPSGSGPLATLAGRLALIVGLSVALFPMYYVFPDTDVTAIEVLPGTVVAAVGLTLAESLFSLYVAWSGNQPDASVVAALVVFLTWLYLSGLVVLIGVATNAVLSNRSRDVSIEPVIGEGPDETDRQQLLDRLADVEGPFETQRPFVITVGTDEHTLPAPVSVQRGQSGDGSVTLQLRWKPAAGSTDERAVTATFGADGAGESEE